MKIEHAELPDLDHILRLQYLAYHSEAELLNQYSIPPLVQTLADVKQEYHNGRILKAVEDDGEIIGSVRGYIRNGTLYIGKLIVHPSYQGKGLGKQLLTAIEQEYPDLRYELFTSSKSERNLKFYEHMGYLRYQEKIISSNLIFVYLEKNKKNI